MAASINASTSAGVVTTADTSGNLNLQSGGTTIVALTSTGAAVTGTLSASAKFTLSGVLNEAMKLTASASGTNGAASYINWYRADGTTSKGYIGYATADTTTFTIGNELGGNIALSGLVVIGTSAPISAGKTTVSFNGLTQNGIVVDNNTGTANASFMVFSNSGDGNGGAISRVGSTAACAYNTTSDYRAKNLFGKFFGASEILSKHIVYDGEFKGGEHRMPLMVAHEVKEVSPWAVTGEKDAVDDKGVPKYQQMAVGAQEALLIAGWQEHERIIQELTARIAALEPK
jgi:hypothetical protein